MMQLKRFSMINQIFNIFKKKYQALNRIEISKAKLLANYQYLSLLNRKVKIAPVLKSNGYGHGLKEVARILDPLGAPFFCVDSIYEAYELYKASIKTPILIMGYVEPQNLAVKKLPFPFAVSTLDLAEAIHKFQPQSGVHIFVDTGMHREGIPLQELPQFLKTLKKLNLKIEGVMSHLATADNPKDPLNALQIKNFREALKICKRYGIQPIWRHLDNSDNLISTSGTISTNLSRVGIALFGIANSNNLNPILNFKTKIIQIKKLKKGDRVGYGGTFTAKKEMTLGVLPLGYYDGLDRRLSNQGSVKVNGQPCKIVGRVSMNITTIDLSGIIDPYISQEVEVFSSRASDPNSIQNAARICQTIPYDILVGLAASTKRVII